VSDEPTIGHNSALNQQDKAALQGLVSEIERHEEEKRNISTDISTIYKSAKDKGFNVKAIRAVIRARQMERAEREALETTIDTYKHALGMLADLPLGQAAVAAATVKVTRGRGKKPPASELDHPDTSDRPFS
jgi:uncharacterized protein (UPF0335 family)